MEPLYNIYEDYDSPRISELSSETPVGWSSICLDQTISYYIEFNSINSNDEYQVKESNHNLE